MDPDDEIYAYTDGSSERSNREVPGGWAFVVGYGGREFTRWGYNPATNNNEMELTAILRVLQFVRKTPHRLHIRTDSDYSLKAITKWYYGWERQGWRTANGSPVKNLELIQHIIRLLVWHREFREVLVSYVKGHNGNVKNEYADKLASTARSTRSTNWDESAVNA